MVMSVGGRVSVPWVHDYKGGWLEPVEAVSDCLSSEHGGVYHVAHGLTRQL